MPIKLISKLMHSRKTPIRSLGRGIGTGRIQKTGSARTPEKKSRVTKKS